jgi:hypothetical protein
LLGPGYQHLIEIFVVDFAVDKKAFVSLMDLRAFLAERFPLSLDKFRSLQLEIPELKFPTLARGCWKSTDGDHGIKIAVRAKKVE